MPPAVSSGGIRLGRGVGKGRYRVRHRLVTEHYAPLIRGKSHGAVKLDILLRCIALAPAHAGRRQPGHVLLRVWTYEDLHDLIRDQDLSQRGTGTRTEQQITKLKRKWVANQLHKLAERQLVLITERPGHTPQLTVLRDDGSGEPYDDPGGAEPYEPYFTIHGSLIAAGELRAWGATEVAAYFACLLAELHHDRGADRPIRPGHEKWWRPLAWFGNDEWDPPRRTILPFSTTLLEEGIASLERRGMITKKLVTKSPRDGRRLPRPRNIYQDRFDQFDTQASLDDRLEELLAAIDAKLVDEPAPARPTAADILIDGVTKGRTPPTKTARSG